MTDSTPAGTSTRWQQIKARRIATPEAQARYDQQRRFLAFVQRLAVAIDERRQHQQMTKAELARRAGAHPAAVRRLLTANAANPTLKTMFELLEALDLELQIQPTARPLEAKVIASIHGDE